jgi:hypothetical protein
MPRQNILAMLDALAAFNAGRRSSPAERRWLTTHG